MGRFRGGDWWFRGGDEVGFRGGDGWVRDQGVETSRFRYM